MSKLNSVIFADSYPSLDLHGFDRQSARVMINDFVRDNKVMGNEIFTIVHGAGTGILRETTHYTLKRHSLVLDFKLDNFNHGMTIVQINVDKK